MDLVSLIGQMAAEPQVDAATVNGAEMKVSQSAVFVSNPTHCSFAAIFGELLGRL